MMRVPIALQIKDVREEVRDAIAARGQSMQVHLRELLEREYRAECNKRLFESLTRIGLSVMPRRSPAPPSPRQLSMPGEVCDRSPAEAQSLLPDRSG
jgi:hypothetical protein